MSDVYKGTRASVRKTRDETNVSLQTPDGPEQAAAIGDISAATGTDKDLNPNAGAARDSGTEVKSPTATYETVIKSANESSLVLAPVSSESDPSGVGHGTEDPLKLNLDSVSGINQESDHGKSDDALSGESLSESDLENEEGARRALDEHQLKLMADAHDSSAGESGHAVNAAAGSEDGSGIDSFFDEVRAGFTAIGRKFDEQTSQIAKTNTQVLSCFERARVVESNMDSLDCSVREQLNKVDVTLGANDTKLSRLLELAEGNSSRLEACEAKITKQGASFSKRLNQTVELVEQWADQVNELRGTVEKMQRGETEVNVKVEPSLDGKGAKDTIASVKIGADCLDATLPSYLHGVSFTFMDGSKHAALSSERTKVTLQESLSAVPTTLAGNQPLKLFMAETTKPDFLARFGDDLTASGFVDARRWLVRSRGALAIVVLRGNGGSGVGAIAEAKSEVLRSLRSGLEHMNGKSGYSKLSMVWTSVQTAEDKGEVATIDSVLDLLDTQFAPASAYQKHRELRDRLSELTVEKGFTPSAMVTEATALYARKFADNGQADEQARMHIEESLTQQAKLVKIVRCTPFLGE